MIWPEAKPIVEALRDRVTDAQEREALDLALFLVEGCSDLAQLGEQAVTALIRENIALKRTINGQA